MKSYIQVRNKMAIIVAGKLILKSNQRNAFIEKSHKSILLARDNKTCLDFAVSPDPLDINRVNVFEKWVNRQALEAFRKSGPEDDLFSLVESFDVSEYEVSGDDEAI